MTIECASGRIAIILLVLAGMNPSLTATSIVILRKPDGAAIVIAADSEFSPLATDGADKGCKIVQIQNTYWTTMSGSINRRTNFPYQNAIDAARRYKGDLSSIAKAFEKQMLRELPVALRQQRVLLGPEEFAKRYRGKSALKTAFVGSEDGVLKLITVEFLFIGGPRHSLQLRPVLEACPGDLCPKPHLPLPVFAGSQEFARRVIFSGVLASKTADYDAIARDAVEAEISNNGAKCACGEPVQVLHIEASGAHWVGEPPSETGPLCRLSP